MKIAFSILMNNNCLFRERRYSALMSVVEEIVKGYANVFPTEGPRILLYNGPPRVLGAVARKIIESKELRNRESLLVTISTETDAADGLNKGFYAVNLNQMLKLRPRKFNHSNCYFR